MSVGFINNTKHFAVTNTSTLIQDALNDGILENPYVAIVDGDLDYNSLEPTPETCYIGEWSDDGKGHYTFSVDTENAAWEDNPIKIGKLLGVSADGNIDDLDVMLSYDTTNDWWHMEFFSRKLSSCPEYDFSGADTWSTGTMVEYEKSGSEISVDYDGDGSFVFSRTDLEQIPINTINPECESDPEK